MTQAANNNEGGHWRRQQYSGNDRDRDGTTRITATERCPRPRSHTTALTKQGHSRQSRRLVGRWCVATLPSNNCVEPEIFGVLGIDKFFFGFTSFFTSAVARPRQLVAPSSLPRHMQAHHRHPARKPRPPRRQAVATRKTNVAYKSPPPPPTAATTRMMAARTMATTIDDADDTNTSDTRPTTTMTTNMRLTTSWTSAQCIKITHVKSSSCVSLFKLQASQVPASTLRQSTTTTRHGARPALTPRHDMQDPPWHPPACKTRKPFPASPAVTPSKRGAQGLPARRNDTDADLTTWKRGRRRRQ
ncbi:hypothetical protein EDB84DRAFT_1615698 [Lactarius hengduanensis]|nr:hypothetical protein EDB84DRAFT_1615698 [Lactarius hengduanensis]